MDSLTITMVLKTLHKRISVATTTSLQSFFGDGLLKYLSATLVVFQEGKQGYSICELSEGVTKSEVE